MNVPTAAKTLIKAIKLVIWHDAIGYELILAYVLLTVQKRSHIYIYTQTEIV